MAIGATPRNVVGLIFRQGFVTVAIGLALGLGAAPLAMRALGSATTGLNAPHPVFITLAALLVTATGTAACWLPARRATRIDPISALREE